MKYTYEKIDISTPIMADVFCIKRTDEDGNAVFIPNDLGNSDYQAYLRWLENPNADEFQPPLEG